MIVKAVYPDGGIKRPPMADRVKLKTGTVHSKTLSNGSKKANIALPFFQYGFGFQKQRFMTRSGSSVPGP